MLYLIGENIKRASDYMGKLAIYIHVGTRNYGCINVYFSSSGLEGLQQTGPTDIVPASVT